MQGRRQEKEVVKKVLLGCKRDKVRAFFGDSAFK